MLLCPGIITVKKMDQKPEKIKKHYVLSVLLIVVALAVGGTLIAVLIYLQSTGRYNVTDVIEAIVAQGQIYGVIVMFWIVIIPLLLIALLVINIVRRIRLKSMDDTWEKAIKVAAERKAAADAAKHAKPSEPRFGTLNSLDEQKPSVNEDCKDTLEELCNHFHMFAAVNYNLYYDISVIRQFVAGLAVSHIIILQGMSGTGKTSLAYAFGEFLNNPSTIVPVQPVWKERTDLLGYYNEFTKRYNETPFLQAMYTADGNDKINIVILDEMNIARVEYYFAEFLSLLEIPNPESRYLEVVPDRWDSDPSKLKDGRIKLPENMWFVGTANNDDSTFAISDKVYDRAMILNLNSKADPFMVESQFSRPINLSASRFSSLISSAKSNYEITNRNLRRLQTLDEYLVEHFQIAFGNRIMRQIRDYIAVYVACGGDEMEALDDIIAKKVLRKLEMQNAVYIKNQSEELCSFMIELFGENKIVNCLRYIRQLARNV